MKSALPIRPRPSNQNRVFTQSGPGTDIGVQHNTPQGLAELRAATEPKLCREPSAL